MAHIQQMVDFPSNGDTVPGYLAEPAQCGAYPGVVLIQEWWGLVPHIKEVAGRFADQGFIALAPDLYHGRQAAEPDEARKLAMELDRQHAVLEIIAAIHYLQGLPQVQPKRIGVVGWCMGGSLAIVTAGQCAEVGATVTFYGMPRELSVVQGITAPLLGLYAEHDHGITLESVHMLEQILEQQGTPHEIHVYPGANHAFFNDTRPQIYDPQAAADAWQRTLDWFSRYL